MPHINTLYAMPLPGLKSLAVELQKKEIKKLEASGRKRIINFVRSFKILHLFEGERSSVLESFYFWARYIDDVIDWDREQLLFKTVEDFILQKRELLEALKNPLHGTIEIEDELDILLVYTCQASRALLKLDVLPLIVDIFESMVYDSIRCQQKRFPSQNELVEYFDKLDTSTIIGALRVMDEDGVDATQLSSLNKAVRLYYSLRDLPADVEKGIFNISGEEAIHYCISIDDFAEIKSLDEALLHPTIGKWVYDQMHCIEQGLKITKRCLKGRHMKVRTRLALFFAFKLPCYRALIRWQFNLGYE